MTKKHYPALMLIHNNNPEKLENKEITDEEFFSLTPEEYMTKHYKKPHLKIVTNEEEV